jgi:hypothetical protein
MNHTGVLCITINQGFNEVAFVRALGRWLVHRMMTLRILWIDELLMVHVLIRS